MKNLLDDYQPGQLSLGGLYIAKYDQGCSEDVMLIVIPGKYSIYSDRPGPISL